MLTNTRLYVSCDFAHDDISPICIPRKGGLSNTPYPVDGDGTVVYSSLEYM